MVNSSSPIYLESQRLQIHEFAQFFAEMVQIRETAIAVTLNLSDLEDRSWLLRTPVIVRLES